MDIDANASSPRIAVEPVRIARVISGGQTGADRAALDAAIAVGVEYAGWCPRSGWAEDLPDPPGLLADYPNLRETRDPDVNRRTSWNVRDSHATLVIASVDLSGSPGTQLTVSLTSAWRRPCLVVEPDQTAPVLEWLDAVGHGLTLNVAGPRESQEPGLYDRTLAFMATLLAANRLP